MTARFVLPPRARKDPDAPKFGRLEALANSARMRQNDGPMSPLAILDREHSIAGEHYSRWLVPPAALAIHLSIGQAYAFSVFNLPLSQRIGITQSAPGDWKLSTIGWVFSVAIVFLGLSAALFGAVARARRSAQGDVRRRRCASAADSRSRRSAIATHQFWLLLLGYGVLGGIGLGSGTSRPCRRSFSGFPTARAWRPAWRSWASAAAR